MEKWESLDRIVERECNGNYVDPTLPNEIDTFDVSEWIQNYKKERDKLDEKKICGEDIGRVKDLLTTEEKASYFEIKYQLLFSDLNKNLPESEYDRLYKKASNILLTAVDREIEKRKEEREAKYLSDEKTRINGEKRVIAERVLRRFPEMTIEEIASLTNLSIEDIEEIKRKL